MSGLLRRVVGRVEAVRRDVEAARRLRPSQLAHRVALRYGAHRPVLRSTPAWRGIAPLPRESRRARAWPFDHEETDGWRFAGRAWPFDASPARAPDPAARSAPLLARYHAGYADWLRAIAEDGDLARARAAYERWFGAAATIDPETDHPYVASRRVIALVEARTAGLTGGEVRIAADAVAVEARIERDVRGNHLVANGVALYRAGAAFAGGPARRWRERGAAILAEAARTQVLADGFHYERSPVYHALVLEHFLIALETAAAHGEPPPRGVEDAARAMAETLQDLVLPDGELLRWKDGAPGLALPHAPLLAWAARRVGPLRPPRRGTRAFESAGLAILATPDGRSAATLLAGPPCPDELPAHGHADALAYELVVDGVRGVASAGTADYAPGPDRDRDRLPGAFAGVLVDGRPPAEPYGAFRVGRRAWVRDLDVESDDDASWVSATSDGFARAVVGGGLHRRTLVLAPGPALLVVDEWTGRGEHDVELAWPLAADAETGIDGSAARIGSLALAAPGLTLRTEPGSFATGLGTVRPRTVLRGWARVRFPVRLVHAWSTRPVASVATTPVSGRRLRVDLVDAGGVRSLYVPQARRP